MNMAICGELGWQSEKSLSECMRHMLENEIATDVCFEVGPPGGETVIMRAHKYMLISRSPVFEAMFSSGMIECKSEPESKVRIEDIDATIFRSVLRFIYYESVDISWDIALLLINAARKYMMTNLGQECTKCFVDSLKVDSVCGMLEQTLLFEESDLTNECLKFIAENSDEILKGDQMQMLSRQAMEIILRTDELCSGELCVYESCVNWAKHQLDMHESDKDPTDLQLRETLGELLFQIRFPTMAADEFSKLLGKSKVLTGDEKSTIYYYINTKEKTEPFLFSTNQRSGKEFWVDRCSASTFIIEPHSPSRVETIDFIADKDIMLLGIGLFTGRQSGYKAEITFLQTPVTQYWLGQQPQTLTLCKTSVSVPYTGNASPFKASLGQKVAVKAGLRYTISVLAEDNILYTSSACQAESSNGNVKIKFLGSTTPLPVSVGSSSTNVKRIQIPRLYFKLCV